MRPCGCPDGGVVPPDREADHRAFHDLVESQTGIAYGQELSMQSIRRARGMSTDAPDDRKTQAKNERLGKSSPGWRRRAARGDDPLPGAYGRREE